MDGLAVLGGTGSHDTIEELAARLPVVVLVGDGPPGAPAVRVDNAAATAALTRHPLGDHELRRLETGLVLPTDLVIRGGRGCSTGTDST
ncbi:MULTISPECIES: hypothetical protein [unclassified Micromonospora]|uniref:hypothetical protein n=1 Tax=unclassified Micromonospora TaxID=2617518 RepID=UPI002FF35546